MRSRKLAGTVLRSCGVIGIAYSVDHAFPGMRWWTNCALFLAILAVYDFGGWLRSGRPLP